MTALSRARLHKPVALFVASIVVALRTHLLLLARLLQRAPQTDALAYTAYLVITISLAAVLLPRPRVGKGQEPTPFVPSLVAPPDALLALVPVRIWLIAAAPGWLRRYTPVLVVYRTLAALPSLGSAILTLLAAEARGEEVPLV